MGFLDDLKRQAEAAKAQQLNVLTPVSKVRYVLDKRHSFASLRMSEFRADARRKKLRDADVFEHVPLHCQLRSGQALAITKDFLPDIEKLEPRLRQCGAEVESQAVRNPDNGKLIEMRYRLIADFVLSVRITPDHERGRVQFQLANLDGLETVHVEFPAYEVGTARLDELARWLVGEPHAFLKDGQQLRRIEA